MKFLWTALLAGACGVGGARADNIDFTALNYHTSLETKTTDMWDNVRVEAAGQIMKADRATINDNDKTVHATGHIDVQKGTISIQAESADLDLKTGFGKFHNAILHQGKMLYAEGREMSSYAEGRYRIIQGKVTTCRDCPQAWSVTGAYMDIEVEGFVEVHHALIQVKDTPIIYLPFYILPIKTKRQSGLLFPFYAKSVNEGTSIGQPYYQVLSDNADTTLTYSFMTGGNDGTTPGGHRLSDEFRYAYSDRSFAEALASIKKGPGGNLWGESSFERWQLTPNFTQRFTTELQSNPLADNLQYSLLFPTDFFNYHLPVLDTEASLAWQSKNLYSSALVHINNDNLARNPQYVGPQQGQIQQEPALDFAAPTYNLWGPVVGGFNVGHVALRRKNGALDPYINWEAPVGSYPGPVAAPTVDTTQWIRTGRRSTLVARLAAPQNVWDYFRWNPTVEARGDAYSFSAPGVPSTAYRVRYLMDQSLSTTFARVWNLSAPFKDDVRALKNTIEPSLRWSYSDYDLKSQHPFFSQGFSRTSSITQSLIPKAPQFDLFDPNADYTSSNLGTQSEELRLHENNLVTLGVATRLIGRTGDTVRSYSDLFSASVAQDVDFFHRGDRGLPTLGFLRIKTAGGYAGVLISTDFALNWSTKNADVNTDLSYRFRNYLLGVFKIIDGTGNNIIGARSEINNIGAWSTSARVAYNLATPGQTLQQDEFRLSYGGGAAKCFYANVVFSKDWGQTSYSWTPEVGFILTESGQKTALNSSTLMQGNNRSSR